MGSQHIFKEYSFGAGKWRNERYKSHTTDQAGLCRALQYIQSSL